MNKLPKNQSLKTLQAKFADSTLEAEFVKDHLVQSVLPFSRSALLIGAILFATYGIADLISLSDPSIAFLPRYFIGFPIMLSAWALTFTRLFLIAHQVVLLWFGVGPMLGTLLIASQANAQSSILYAGWSSVFISVAPLVARFTFRTQLIYVFLSTLIVYSLEWNHQSVDIEVKRGLVWTLITMGFFGAFLAWLNEYQHRLHYLAQRTIIAQAEEIQIERRRSDGLLNNILPTSIAERLKNQEGTIADSHSEVTVLFADIVGFTALSSRLSAPDLVKKLNSVFTEFDLLCSELGLEKIKTIGDAYMVVGGIPNARPDHAKATVMMAIGMQKIIQKHREIHQDNLDIRIGIHSGPLVAGVIGKNKFAYDTWGDTVNTASRMESHSIAGRIQVSESTAELIKQDFELEDRGIIDIKGKGGMRTWLVKDTKSNFKRS